MKKPLLTITIAVIGLAFITSCAQKKETPAPTTAASAHGKKPGMHSDMAKKTTTKKSSTKMMKKSDGASPSPSPSPTPAS